MRALTVASFEETDSVQPLHNRLEEMGIHNRIFNENLLQRTWFMSKPHAGIKIQVDRADFEKALHALHDLDVQEHLLDNAVRCPDCSSSRIEYPQFTRKFIMPTFLEFFCVVGLMDREYYCENCHFTWPSKAKAAPRELDPLGFPIKKPRAKKA